MKRFLTLLICGALLFVMGCSSLTVDYDYDRQADFSKLKSYAWLAQSFDATSTTARQAQQQNSLFYKRLKTAVNSVLEAKGYVIDTEDPDFVITYHTGVQDKVNVTNWGYSYGPYWGPYGGDVTVDHYQEGTLIIDMIDTETKQLVWRGTAQKALESNPDPEKVDEMMHTVASRLLENFPPK
jgi:hypothetical protein